MEVERLTEEKKEEKPKADMSAAAKKAWKTRREKYGESGLSKKTEKVVEQGGKVASKKKGKAEEDAKAKQLKKVIEKESENPSD